MCESWLDSDILDNVVDVPEYVTYRRDRQDGRIGGGVACFVRVGLPCTRLTELETADVEALWLLYRNSRMPRNISHLLIAVIYHPPNANSFNTTSYIVDCLDKVIQKHPYVGIVIFGDFNCLNDRMLLSFPLKQTVRNATRQKHTG